MSSPASFSTLPETATSPATRWWYTTYRWLIALSLVITCLLWQQDVMEAGWLALGLLLWLWSLHQAMALMLKGRQPSEGQWTALLDVDQRISGFPGVVYCYCPIQHQYCYRANMPATIRGLSHQACQLTCRAFDAMVHPDDRADLQRARRLALQQGYYEHTYRLIHGTGIQRVLDRGVVLRRGGKPECHGLLMDISGFDEIRTPPQGDFVAQEQGTNFLSDNSGQHDATPSGRLSRSAPFVISEALSRALIERQLRVIYQPQVQGHDECLAGFEALLRWHHPVQGEIAPSAFIPVAESTGLISSLGQWVIEEVCRQIRRWRSQGYQVPLVAINVSVLQLNQSLLTQVARVLADYHLEGACLEFEITESRLMQNFDECVHVLSGLRQQGIRISLDDFGTGYSSLDKLALLPLDRLKLDKCFVEALTGASHGYHMIEAVVRMAHALHLAVVAEGVETPRQQQLLGELSCDILQGYLFGAGGDANTVISYLSRDPDDAPVHDPNARRPASPP
ncbi:EAL domain, c-di-GMP-specific phosphodiesterase class I (or its enzymatically inactive variant) [Kushneria avicenniae]|uniref:EAL domain, c-di-GMP-specific phosphodiesterase class I (Or its enzymatically inactive variant) n=1 Tax=Kushneria avicenniae TaxID=402385 RepID=A0A1I1HUI5_9GAMM|nr:EAL domain-containing protein [Kushneria avicenniae]SFC27566.1 EAL domain, c-di-GMP-specific phosphodiesterase class I (or its enzymatically inactive variant) [Kushneria avicenniae]